MGSSPVTSTSHSPWRALSVMAFLLSELNAAGGVFVLPKQVGLCFVEPKSVTLFLYAPHSKSALWLALRHFIDSIFPPTSPKSPGQASDPSQKASIRCPWFSVSEQDFCCHRRKTADDKDIEQIKQTMLERVESIEPRIRDYAEEWHINIFRQKDLRWRYKKNSAYHYLWCWRYSWL